MINKLLLHIPSLVELWYRQQIMNDPDTMEYNKGYNLGYEGYHNITGCIDFPETQWESWYHWFVNGKPQRFYAYIVRREDNTFIGEVNAHPSSQGNWHDMGIVIESKYRGLRYATEALDLLLKEVFETMPVNTIHNNFEMNRIAALRTHLSSGFQIISEDNGIINLCITKERFFHQQSIKHSISKSQ